MSKQSKSVVVILLSGRPRVITDGLPPADVMGGGLVAGHRRRERDRGCAVRRLSPFTGKTAYSWPRSMEQLPINVNNANR
ncbi:MAG: glycoside hydrolase family 3 C-terminal domain-containing protein [Candidatus Moduliflexus flocculans]|nr:glycoside hydrolase family 3 C-terminal domain-containing protein [Candidatus Moduliflexus flocculans]